MPKLYYVRDELGEDGPLYATLKEAQDEFQDWIIRDVNQREFIRLNINQPARV